MKKYFFLVFVWCVFGCVETHKKQELSEGAWQGRLSVMDGEVLPFNFKVYKNTEENYMLDIFNAEEVIKVDEVIFENDSLVIQMPVFEGYITAHFSSVQMKGAFIIESLERSVPFEATYGESKRFIGVEGASVDVSGVWQTEFSPNTEDNYMGKGIFTQKDNQVMGTFRTTTGDYRFLEGVLDNDSLKLSTFDGAHAFLFKAKVTDSSMNGTFYSGNHFKEPFIAVRNENYELPSPDSLTFLKDGYDKFDFTFPDLNGNMVSLNSQQFKDKVVVVQIMGSWCPNCLDETKFLVDYLSKKNREDLAVVGLAFEYAKTEELAHKSIKRLVDRIGVEYPILLAQYGTENKEKAQEKLPMLNRVLSYPTTIFIDKKGVVRKIHTGFNGPATGDKFEEFKSEFDSFLQQLLSEE
ncbi:TlpA family protein disulfide reductase [Maribacter sp. MMG018]|uniref:TlpA disulfide reductase family protein n=1 Tax=Maribacter sp. MMG018 TaxID=2822688 RepID=UPI001B37A6C1|nr:TlpA disulfide reductase family protein [Maribacter sp. MMG018]MBQ4914951.1 TlpA family protein disulfide reductase [Maribacter sp. MMG018]